MSNFTISNGKVNSRVEKYINVIDPIPEGERNPRLYNTGLLLRSNFGLTGNDLESALSEVNGTKCTPPLSENEVIGIASSVDQSNAPVGESCDSTYKPANRRKVTKPPIKQYAITVSDTPIAVTELLKKEVSLYTGFPQKGEPHTPTGTSNIRLILDTIRTGGKSRGQILDVRSESDKDKRDKLKKKLSCVVFGSEPQTERKATACTPNGIFGLDFDSIPMDELESAKKAISEVAYVFAVFVSASGSGLFALAAYEGTSDLKTLLAAMQADFRYPLDSSCSDICRLRFASLDENLIVKDEVFPAVLSVPVPITPENTEENGTYGYGDAPVNQFSLAKGTDEILQIQYPPMRWIVEGLIPEGLTILAGQSKAGKSWLLLQLGLAAAKGRDFLGFKTVKTKAIYLAIEDSERRIQSRMHHQQQTGSANLKILDHWEGGIDALVRDLPAHPDVKLLVIDTWGRFVGTKIDGNDYHEVTEAIGRLHSIAKEQGIAIIVCTHTKKGPGASDWLDDVIGSKALVACADTILKLSRERNSNEGNIDVTGRDVQEQSIAICRDDFWRWNLSALNGMPEDTRIVLSVLQNVTHPMSEREIKKASRRLRDVDIEPILQKLVADGTVEKALYSGGHRPTYRYEIIRSQTVPVPITPKNIEENGTYGYGDTADTPDSDTLVYDQCSMEYKTAKQIEEEEAAILECF